MKPFNRAPSSRFKRCVAVLLVAWLSVATSHAAANALRLGNQLNGWLDFVNNPNSFPVCKAGLTHLSGGGSQHLFDTTNFLLAVALNTSVSNTFISGADVVNSLANAESAGNSPTAFWIYREDWLNMTNGIPGGPFTNDWRILTLTEISNIRAAIAYNKGKTRR